MDRSVYPQARQAGAIVRSLFLLAFTSIACMHLCSCAEATGVAADVLSRPREKVRVACVGDSITYGAGIRDRDKDSYPAQLAALLGADWDVRNFGVNSATALKNGGKPYYLTQAYTEALAFLPHVVIIHLGTNDALPEDWQKKDDFVRDYRWLIKSFRKLGSKPVILLCAPIPAYRNGADADPVIQEEVIPRIREIGQKMGLSVIDLNGAFLGKKELIVGVHPNEQGARLMAEKVYESVRSVKREEAKR